MTLEQKTFAEVEIRRARRTDTETSKTAAAHSHGLAAEHRLLILAAMRDGGAGTAHEIATRCDLEAVQVSRRLRELVDDGEIRATGETRPTPSGRPAQCYETINRIP